MARRTKINVDQKFEELGECFAEDAELLKREILSHVETLLEHLENGGELPRLVDRDTLVGLLRRCEVSYQKKRKK